MGRQRGSGQFGPDVLVGSAEYAKKMREKHPDSFKMAQAKYRLKQKQLILAQKVAVADGIPFDQAYAEITGRMDAVVQVRSELVNEGRIDHHNGPPPLPPEDDGMPPPEMMAEESRTFGVPYVDVVQKYRDLNKKFDEPVVVDEDFLSTISSKVDVNEEEEK